MNTPVHITTDGQIVKVGHEEMNPEDLTELKIDSELPEGITPEDLTELKTNSEQPEQEGTVMKKKSRKPKVIEGNLDTYLDAFTPEQTRQENRILLQQAKTRREILEHKIIAVEPAADLNSSPRVYVQYKGFKVAISTKDFFGVNLFSDDLNQVSAEERNTREFKLISHMLGAYIPFIITEAQKITDEAGTPRYIVTASRKLALEKRKKHYFLGKTSRVEEGDRIKVRILMPTSRGVIVDVLGVETFVPTSQFSSYKWVDPDEDFPTGTVAYLDIESLEIDKETGTVKVKMTGQTIDYEMAVAAYQGVSVGMKIHGTVIAVDANYVRINLDNNVRGAAYVISLNGRRLHYGDRVSLHVKNKKDDRMTVYGNCVPISMKQR